MTLMNDSGCVRGSATARLAVVLAVAVLLSACGGRQAMYRRKTLGLVGCRENEIGIHRDRVNFSSGQQTWEATCRGKTYFCTYQGAALVGQATEREGTLCHLAD